MCRFQIMTDNSLSYDAVVFSEGCDSPLENLGEVVRELIKSKKNISKVLFDELLNIGNSSDRFVEALFENGDFKKNSFQIVNFDSDANERIFCSQFYRENDNLLEYSMLTSKQIKRIRSGEII